MEQYIAQRLYLIFALGLLLMGWKMCESVSDQLFKVQKAQAAKIERLMTEAE